MAEEQRRFGKPELPEEFLRQLEAVQAKRPRVVIDHILENGHVTTEELRELYGYDHPPRAARDVREQGIPLETFRVIGKQGRTIGAYRFGNPGDIRRGRLGGRRAWPNNFKRDLVNSQGSRCAVCLAVHQPRELQIDHKVPYEVASDPEDISDLANFMLLCSSCNRAKSWSCEHCRNWTDEKDADICRTCYWADPENYIHVSLRYMRRLAITWAEAELSEYERLLELSRQTQVELPEFVKDIIRAKLDIEFKPG